jgi:hypothetical protein
MCVANINIYVQSAAQKLMKLSSKKDLEQYISTRENWRVESSVLLFKSDKEIKHGDLIPAHQLISETLQYANDLERIV